MLWIVLGNLTNLEILNSQWFSTSNDEFGNFKPELEGKVEALPTDQVVDKVTQQYRKISDHFRERSWLARVTSVIGVHFSQKSIP